MRRVVVVAVMLVTGGCGLSAQHSSLPGHHIPGDKITVVAVFDDALNLSEGAPVKFNGLTIGQVDSVTADDYRAKVTMSVQSAAGLNAGTSARLRGTTPLGELFVDLTDGSKPEALANGAHLADTSTAPTIEDTMATASLFINGGGLAELGTIVRESNLAIGGREQTAQDLLIRLDRTTSELASSTSSIEGTLTSLAALSMTLRNRQDLIDQALTEIGPAANAVSAQVDELVALLKQIESFGGTAKDIITTVRADVLSGLAQMGPIFNEMNSLEHELTPVIETLASFGTLLDGGVPTSYLNTFLHFHLEQINLNPPGSVPAGSAPTGAAPTAPAADLPASGLDQLLGGSTTSTGPLAELRKLLGGGLL